MSKLESLILRRAGAATHAKVAQAIGKDQSTMSRIFSGQTGLQISDLEAFFDSLGLKVVELGGDAVSIPAEKYRALQVLARESLRFDDEKGPQR